MDTHECRRLLGLALRDARRGQRLSQRRLAAMAGTNQSYLWEIETGRVSVGLDTLCRISTALDVPLDVIFAQVCHEYDGDAQRLKQRLLDDTRREDSR